MFESLRRVRKQTKGSPRNRRVATFLHVALWPLLLIPRLFWPPGARRRPISRILLIRVDGIGDLTMSAAVFPSLRRHFPDARIDLLTSETASPIAGLFEAQKWVDTVWRMPLLGRGVLRYWRLARQFRKQRYDAAIDLRGDLRNILLMWLAGVPIRLGLEGTALAYLLTGAEDVPADPHQARESANLIRRLGVADVEPWPRLPLQPDHLADADRWLAENGVSSDRPLCAFHLGAFYTMKLWPVERFEAVARRLHERTGAQVVVVGGPPEAEMARTFAGRLNFPVAVAAGKTSLLQSAAIVARCDAYLGADSGPAHVAAAVGTPVIVLFGPTDPAKYRPLSPRVTVMKSHAPCDPGCHRDCVRPATHCMLDHTVEAVAAAAEALVRESHHRRAAAAGGQAVVWTGAPSHE